MPGLFGHPGLSSPLRRAGSYFYLAVALVMLLSMVSCSLPLVPAASPENSASTTPAVESTAGATAQPGSSMPAEASPSPTPLPIRLWLPDYLPQALRSAIALAGDVVQAYSASEADLALQVVSNTEAASTRWVYALVAPFPTIPDEVTAASLKSAWDGQAVPPFDKAPLLMDQSTQGVFSAYWGAPSPQSVLVMPTSDLLDYAWQHRPSFAILPFEQVEPRWKVLVVDGQSPIRKDFNALDYPLSIPLGLVGVTDLPPAAISLPSTNRDPSLLTTVAMTGVTAMVRATAFTMEQEGISYPAEDIGSLLASADITHISNEIPFFADCPDPTPTMPALIFCSKPSYIELLKAVGTDIVELTGDHFMDYGADATLYTLQMYKDLGWKYYGGGANAAEARQPVLLENNGNRLAFMGCNVGCTVKNEIPCDAIATADHPGAAQCDFKWITPEIASLKEQGYNVIFTFQHREYYTYTTESILKEDFGLVAAAGATIVSGSQAHQAHGFSFSDGSFIHYGLGNLFFDQYHYCVDDACDYAFIDRHVFYAGRHISTELITIRFVDFARPRLMTPEERSRFLEIIFTASGW